MPKKLTRRDFLKLAGVTSAGLALSACGVKATESPIVPFLPSAENITSTLSPTPSPYMVIIQRNIQLIADTYSLSSDEAQKLIQAILFYTDKFGENVLNIGVVSFPKLNELGFTEPARIFKTIDKEIPIIFKTQNDVTWKTFDIATWCRECGIEFRTRETVATSSTYGNNARGEVATTIMLDFSASILGDNEEYSFFNRTYNWKSIIKDLPEMIENIKMGEVQFENEALGRVMWDIDIIRDDELTPFGIHEFIGHTLLGGVELLELGQIKQDLGLSGQEAANLYILLAASKTLYMAKPRRGEDLPFMKKSILVAEVSSYLGGTQDVIDIFESIGGYEFIARLEDVCQQAYTSTYGLPLVFIIAEDFSISESGMSLNSDLRDERDYLFNRYLPSLRAAGVKAPFLMNELMTSAWTHDPPTEAQLTQMFQNIYASDFIPDAPDFVAVRGKSNASAPGCVETVPLGDETEDERALEMLQTIFSTYLKNGIARLGIHSVIDLESKSQEQLVGGLPSPGLAPYEVGPDGVARRTPAYYTILNAIFQNTPRVSA